MGECELFIGVLLPAKYNAESADETDIFNGHFYLNVCVEQDTSSPHYHQLDKNNINVCLPLLMACLIILMIR